MHESEDWGMMTMNQKGQDMAAGSNGQAVVLNACRSVRLSESTPEPGPLLKQAVKTSLSSAFASSGAAKSDLKLMLDVHDSPNMQNSMNAASP